MWRSRPRSYWAPRAPQGRPTRRRRLRRRDVARWPALLPLSELSLRVTAAPFAIPGGPSAVVTLALGVRQPAFAERTPEQIELLVKAFTPDGDRARIRHADDPDYRAGRPHGQ